MYVVGRGDSLRETGGSFFILNHVEPFSIQLSLVY